MTDHPQRCSEPGCTQTGEMYIHSKCHPRSATWAVYDRQNETVRIECCACEKPIVTFRLRPRALEAIGDQG
jgi:hypothetical protein